MNMVEWIKLTGKRLMRVIITLYLFVGDYGRCNLTLHEFIPRASGPLVAVHGRMQLDKMTDITLAGQNRQLLLLHI